MKLQKTVMQSLQDMVVEIGHQPACKFVESISTNACGGCSGDCKGAGCLD